MTNTLPYETSVAFTEVDDSMHAAGPALDWTETTWWSFNVPERGLAGWLYVQTRPNLGLSSGGAFVYGPNTWAAWEAPYYAYFHHLPMPNPLDLRDVQFKNGVYVKMLEPGQSYDIGYRFRDQTEFTADLHFEGLTAPVPHLRGQPPFTGSSHYDQHGRVTGTLLLNGEKIPVDCISVRDRSWGRRPERIGMDVARLSYVFGSTSDDEAFLVFCQPPADDQDADFESLSSGYLWRDGALRYLESATRRNLRDEATGGVSTIELDAIDTDGRQLVVTGQAISRLALHTSNLCVGTFMGFEVASSPDGLTRTGYGEDQDVWPLARYARRFSRQ